jgi:hypothetical protein
MKLRMIMVCLICVTLSGCAFNSNRQGNIVKNTIKAFYTENPVCVDGMLNEQIWKKAIAYPMYLSRDKVDAGQELKEKGEIRVAWDKDYFYLAASFEDSDIIAQGKEDQMHHYQYGDLCELFLKPADDSYYWELYATPAGKKSSFFYPSKGYLGLPGCLEDYQCGLKVAANCNGTINNWKDRDKSWTAEMAMPIKDLESFGAKFEEGSDWRIFVGRYNYSRYLLDKELSMTPQLSKTNYHLIDEYAGLELVR